MGIDFWDNLSTDNSKIILESFKDKRIHYYRSEKFLNLYEARNKAIKKASGKYVCFLDTDDLFLDEKIYDQVKFLEKIQIIKWYTPTITL